MSANSLKMINDVPSLNNINVQKWKRRDGTMGLSLQFKSIDFYEFMLFMTQP